MAESFQKVSGNKHEQYNIILPQLLALIQAEPDCIATLANITAVLKEQFEHLWIGFYLVKDNQLLLGPFQGPLACTRIDYGKGVCGACWQQQRSIIVDDVAQFPGHIACSSLSRSEIVVPILKDNKVVAVLDIDSIDIAKFDAIDQQFLEMLAHQLSVLF